MNHKEKELKEKLQQDVVIPDVVWEKANQAFSQIKGTTVTEIPIYQERNQSSRKKAAKWRIWSAAAAAAVVVLGGGVFFASNPALAAQLPIIGRIFAQIEENATFSGDFSSKADVLVEEDFAEEPKPGFQTEEGEEGFAAEDAQEAGNASQTSAYTVSDNQMTMTASEVYCDGMSIYLTFQVEYEGDLGEIPAHYTRQYNENTAQTFYAFGTWGVNGEEPVPMENNYLEGKQLDEHTFTGMMRLDLNRFPEIDQAAELDLNISRLGADNLLVDSSQLDDIGPMLSVDGTWNFHIPVTVDTEAVQKIEVEEAGEDGYGVASVTFSPYQLTVETLYPGSRDTIPKEEYGDYVDELVRQFASDKDGFTQEEAEEYVNGLTDQEILYYFGKVADEPEVAVFTQDGTSLDPYEGLRGKMTFAVQGKEIKELHIFVGTDEFADLLSAQTMEEAAQKAYFSVTVPVQ